MVQISREFKNGTWGAAGGAAVARRCRVVFGGASTTRQRRVAAAMLSAAGDIRRDGSPHRSQGRVLGDFRSAVRVRKTRAPAVFHPSMETFVCAL